MSEADFERQVVKWAHEMGGIAPKLKEDNKRGFPDRTILLPNRTLIFAELKTPRGKASKQQEKWINDLKDLGFAAGFYKNIEDIENDWRILKGGS